MVYGKKRGGDEHPAAQFFIYYNLSLRFEVVENNLSATMLRKVFFGGVRGGRSIYLSMRHVRSFTPAMLSAIQSFKDLNIFHLTPLKEDDFNNHRSKAMHQFVCKFFFWFCSMFEILAVISRVTCKASLSGQSSHRGLLCYTFRVISF